MNAPYYAAWRSREQYVVCDARTGIAHLLCTNKEEAEALADQLNQWAEQRT